jgi:uncharacterized protein YndB with AHSA1/START domain
MKSFLGGMNMVNGSIIFERKVAAPVGEVYRAFANSTTLREWLCSTATVDPHEGGHLFLKWDSGFYCAGEFLSLKQDEELNFTSFGKDEPNPTCIRISMKPSGKGSSLLIEHTGLKPVWKWRKYHPRITTRWTNALENLVHVLEVGPDLRIVNRPMLGIFFSAFDEGLAKRLGIPIHSGVHLEGVVSGMGAEACGLKKDDVVVEMDGKEIKNINSLTNVLSAHKAKDKLSVVFFRGSKKIATDMVLSARNLPPIPASPAAFASAYQKKSEQDYKELSAVFKGIPEALAAKKPAKNEWSANENVAHLLEGERGWHFFIHELLFSAEQVSDNFGDNSNERIQAEIAAYPTTKDLLLEFKRSQQVTVGFLKNLPKSFQAHKGTWWRLATALLTQPNTHVHEHVDQIKKTFELVIKKRKN